MDTQCKKILMKWTLFKLCELNSAFLLIFSKWTSSHRIFLGVKSYTVAQDHSCTFLECHRLSYQTFLGWISTVDVHRPTTMYLWHSLWFARISKCPSCLHSHLGHEWINECNGLISFTRHDYISLMHDFQSTEWSWIKGAPGTIEGFIPGPEVDIFCNLKVDVEIFKSQCPEKLSFFVLIQRNYHCFIHETSLVWTLQCSGMTNQRFLFILYWGQRTYEVWMKV